MNHHTPRPGRRVLLSLALALGAALLGCDARIDNEKKESAQKQDPVALAEKGTGFSVGPATARHVTWVFYDMQCPHCGDLWQAAKPLQDRVRFVWIPVALLNAGSLEQGAAVLGQGDPAAAMDRHEAERRAGQPGLQAAASAELREKVQANTQLLRTMGAQSVPYIVGRNENSDKVVTEAGALPTEELRKLLGI